jgi:hypothetical protein
MSLNPPPPMGPPLEASLSVSERKTVSNRFGTVTNLAVHYNVKKNLFAGVKREDLIMRHVVAAKLETSRHAIWGAILALMGATWLSHGGSTSILAIIPLAAGVLLLWGSPRVSVTAADGAARPSIGWPWTRSEAEQFVNGVSKELLARG